MPTILVLSACCTKRLSAFELGEEWRADHQDNVKGIAVLDLEEWLNVDGGTSPRRTGEF